MTINFQDHVVSQITLINGEKIWVREEKSSSWANSSVSSHSTHSTTSSGDDCNSSTDSINVCVPLFVSTSPVNQVAELDLSSEMMDLTAFLGNSTPPNNELQVLKPQPNQQVLVNKDPYSTIVTKINHQETMQPTKPGNSLLRSALTGKTSYLMTKQQKQQQNQQLPTFRPGSESSKIGEQKVEEILLLAKKRTLENLPTSSQSSIFTSSGDKLVINTANLLNTAASQLNLAPPSLSSLVPVRTTASIQNSSSGDSNNNIKTIPPPPASVISLVVDVGNNNSSTSTNLNLTPASILDTDLDSIPINIPTPGGTSGGTKKRILKRQKSSSSSGSSPSGHGALIQTFSSSPSLTSTSSNVSSQISDNQEPRKEARLLHYCPICNKGFKDRYSVNVHVRTHTGEKPFSCALCGKCFRQKAHLAKHHQTHAAKQSVLQQQPQTSKTTTIVEKMPVTTPAAPQAPPLASTPTINEEKIVFPLSPVSLELSS